MKTFNIKRIFLNYFKDNPFIEDSRVFLRLYDPSKDVIYPRFSTDDWNMIFTEVDETTFINMGKYYIDRIILIGFDKLSGIPFGFACVQESHETPMEVSFHGGTWEHDVKNIILEYISTDLLLNFLVKHNFNVTATCFITNVKADRFQKSLGFVEYNKDSQLSYKRLPPNALEHNIVRKWRGRMK